MIRRRPWAVAGALILMIVLGLAIRNQVKVYRNRLAQEALSVQETLRRSLLTELQPVALKKCTLERFGEANDGGYLMCANLLDGVEAGYSYGISGYDQWGCDISTKLNVPLHQYDCFDTRAPACPDGKTMFHAECVGGSKSTVEQRLFDSIENQLAKNSDREKRVVVKMDVEGAEWESLLATSDDVLQRIDQLAIEFHWIQSAEGEWPFDRQVLSADPASEEALPRRASALQQFQLHRGVGAVSRLGVRSAVREQASRRRRSVAAGSRPRPVRCAERFARAGLPAIIAMSEAHRSAPRPS